jgi:glutaredoxin
VDATRRSFIGLVLLVGAIAVATQWLGDRAEERLGEQVAAAAHEGDIRMLSSLTCPYCTQARLWFERHGVPFDECFVERDAACEAELDALPRPATPTLIVRGQVQTGFDAERVLHALQAPPG